MMAGMCPAVLLSLLALVAPPQQPVVGAISCTPNSVLVNGQLTPSANPIATALSFAGPGTIILLSPGDYPRFSIGMNSKSAGNARTAGGRPGIPVLVQGSANVRINGVGGTDAISIAQQIPNGWITFRNLTILPGSRAGVIFYRGGIHAGYRFEDCNIIGGYDHVAHSGPPSKWGVSGWGLRDFAFIGTAAYAKVANIRDEHGFYLQNCAGDVRIERVDGFELGRTFLQLTARSREGPPGTGTVTVRDCRIRDTGLASGDGWKGGSSITIGGRHVGTVLLDRVSVITGYMQKLKILHGPNEPYGTGALMVLDRNEPSPNGTLIVRDCEFRFAPDCGDRPLVSIGGCMAVRFEGNDKLVAGKYGIALDLDPLHEENGQPQPGQLNSRKNGLVTISPGTKITGQRREMGVVRP